MDLITPDDGKKRADELNKLIAAKNKAIDELDAKRDKEHGERKALIAEALSLPTRPMKPEATERDLNYMRAAANEVIPPHLRKVDVK